MTVMQNLNVLENTHIKLQMINKISYHTNLLGGVARANFITTQLHNYTEKQTQTETKNTLR